MSHTITEETAIPDGTTWVDSAGTTWVVSGTGLTVTPADFDDLEAVFDVEQIR